MFTASAYNTGSSGRTNAVGEPYNRIFNMDGRGGVRKLKINGSSPNDCPQRSLMLVRQLDLIIRIWNKVSPHGKVQSILGYLRVKIVHFGEYCHRIFVITFGKRRTEIKICCTRDQVVSRSLQNYRRWSTLRHSPAERHSTLRLCSPRPRSKYSRHPVPRVLRNKCQFRFIFVPRKISIQCAFRPAEYEIGFDTLRVHWLVEGQFDFGLDWEQLFAGWLQCDNARPGGRERPCDLSASRLGKADTCYRFQARIQGDCVFRSPCHGPFGIKNICTGVDPFTAARNSGFNAKSGRLVGRRLRQEQPPAG